MTTNRSWTQRITRTLAFVAVSVTAFLLVAWIVISAVLNSPNFRMG